MNLANVMQELAERLDTIAGLRVHGHPPDKISTPAAVVTYPDTYNYDETYARGMDRLELPVVVLVGKVHLLSARNTIGAYADGAGAKSVKAVLEAGTYTQFDTVRVTGVTFDIVEVAGVEYLGATFTVDITGQGA